MPPRTLARPARIRVSLRDLPPAGVAIPLPARRMWPAGLITGAMFVAFAGVALSQIRSLTSHGTDSVFSLMTMLFRVAWLMGWSVGVVVLFLLTVLFLFYREAARIVGDRLIFQPSLGPLKTFVEYELAKVRNLRVAGVRGGEGRITFNYESGECGLGNAMPWAEAERKVATIEAAIAALGPRATEPDAPTTPVAPAPRAARPPAAPVPRRGIAVEPAPTFGFSTLVLIGANLVPLIAVLFFHWSLAEVMVLFWAENAVIGVFTLAKLVIVGRWAALFVGPFFAGHYGGFMAAHFMFVYYLFVRGASATGVEPAAFAALKTLFVPLWPALLALVLSHGVSFFTNFIGRKEYVGRSVKEQMGEPYKRIIILHVTLIFGGWAIMLLKSPLPALVILIVLKTAVDLRAHRRERAR